MPPLFGDAISEGVAFFFLGNCQLQYFANHIHRHFPKRVYVSGRMQVPVTGPPPILCSAIEFFTAARQRRARGGDNILIVQETTLSQFSRSLTPARLAAFSHVQRIPFAHFRSLWPHFRLATQMDFTPRVVRRLFESERIEFRDALNRAGGQEFDDELYWKSALEELQFYHPGHPGGKILLSLHDVFLEPLLLELGAPGLSVRQDVAGDAGLPLMSLHPIAAEWGDALDVRWHRDVAYGAWNLIAENPAYIAAEVLEAARAAMTNTFGAHFSAFFSIEAAKRCVDSGDHLTAAQLSTEAAMTLTGQIAPLGRALASNARLRRWRDIEAVLMRNLAHMYPPSPLEPVIERWLRRNAGDPDARAALARVASHAPHAPWLSQLAESGFS